MSAAFSQSLVEAYRLLNEGRSPGAWDGKTRPRYVAICGFPETGKTTLAEFLVQRYGAELVDDGAVLREAAQVLFGASWQDVNTQEGKRSTRTVCGVDYTHRALLGDLGTMLEDKYGEQFIPERTIARLEAQPARETVKLPFHVFASVRKTQGITYHKNGGIVLEVLRPGTRAVYDFDRYDRDLVDHSLLNNGDLPGLFRQAQALFEGRLGFQPATGAKSHLRVVS